MKMAKEKLERFNASQASLMTKAARLSQMLTYRAEYEKVIEKIKESALEGNSILSIDEDELSTHGVIEMLIDDGYKVIDPDYEYEETEYIITWSKLTTKE